MIKKSIVWIRNLKLKIPNSKVKIPGPKLNLIESQVEPDKKNRVRTILKNNTYLTNAMYGKKKIQNNKIRATRVIGSLNK